MKKTILLLAALLCAAAAHSASAARYVPGEALVVFRKATGASVTASSVERGLESFRVASLAAASGARAVRAYGALSEAGDGVFALIRSESKTTERLVEDLKARADVIAASPNYIVRAFREPNDPRYLSGGLWGLGAIRAPRAWDLTTGSGDVYVAIADTGVYAAHEDLKANLATEFCRNFTQVDENTPAVASDYIDVNGHGTHVAGTIGAVGNNGLGVAGVNWQVRLIALRVLDAGGAGDASWSMAALNHLSGLLRTNPQMKVAALNLSLGFYANVTPTVMQSDPYWMAFKILDDLNRTVIVVAAGNEGLEVGRPAPYDDPASPTYLPEPRFKKGDYGYPASFTGLNNLIVVGAAASDDAAADFSNWSPTAVHLAAPGDGILSTVFPAADNDGTPYGTWYGEMSGTSMAAPHVAGAVALLAARYPNATAAQLKAALLNGADAGRNPVATAPTNASGATLSRYGYLDVKAALDKLAAAGSQDISPDPEPSPLPEPEPRPRTRSSSGSGCDAGSGFLALSALALPLLRRRG